MEKTEQIAHLSKIQPLSPRPISSMVHGHFTVKNPQRAASKLGLGGQCSPISVESRISTLDVWLFPPSSKGLLPKPTVPGAAASFSFKANR